MNSIHDQSHEHNFDALVGRWKVFNRRKKGNYFLSNQACGEEAEWEEFSGHDRFEKQLDAGRLLSIGRRRFLQGREHSGTV